MKNAKTLSFCEVVCLLNFNNSLDMKVIFWHFFLSQHVILV